MTFAYPFLKREDFGRAKNTAENSAHYNKLFQDWINAASLRDQLDGCKAVWGSILGEAGVILIPTTAVQAELLGQHQATIESSLAKTLRDWLPVDVWPA